MYDLCVWESIDFQSRQISCLNIWILIEEKSEHELYTLLPTVVHYRFLVITEKGKHREQPKQNAIHRLKLTSPRIRNFGRKEKTTIAFRLHIGKPQTPFLDFRTIRNAIEDLANEPIFGLKLWFYILETISTWIEVIIFLIRN